MKEKTFAPAEVLYQEALQEGIFSLTLATAAAETARPGQFVNLYLNDRTHLLPRPISICEIDKDAGSLRLVYRVKGEGTREISDLVTGQTIDLMGPLGNGFPLEGDFKAPVIIGGGIGVPPMLSLSEAIPGEKTVVCGYLDAPFLTEEFEAAGGRFVIATESGRTGTKGNVLDAMAAEGVSGDVLFACGPKPMLAAIKEYAAERSITCYISMEERMACGIGACLGCVTKTTKKDSHSKVMNSRVCTDGPVYDAAEVDL